jgi:hypothetical protein
MDLNEDLDARKKRIKALWEELRLTPRESPRHRGLVEDILAESAAFLGVVDAARGVARKPDRSD